MNTPDKQNIENQIEAVIRLNRTFTAYDITQMLRKRNFYIKHDVVRTTVHSYTMPTHYNTTQQLIKGAPAGTQATIFHKIGNDPIDYNPYWVEQEGLTAQPTTVKLHTNFVTQQQNTKQTNNTKAGKVFIAADGTFTPQFGSRSRMTLKTQITRTAGFNEGDVVYINSINNKLYISRKTTGKRVTIGKHNVIRLRKCDYLDAFNVIPNVAKVEIITHLADPAIVITKVS